MNRNATFAPVRAGAVLALALLMAAPASMGSTVRVDGGFAAMLDDARLVFQGVVTDVEYAMSEPLDGIPSLPHTFVTFTVEQVFKGQVEDGTFTLRLLGGLLDDGTYLEGSGIPWFDLDERMIVLARGNGTLDNPVVGETEGLLRVVGDRVYTYEGRTIHVSGDLELARGHREPLEVVQTRRIALTDTTLPRPRSEPDDPDQAGAESESGEQSAAVSISEFQGWLARATRLRGAPVGPAATPMKSASPDMPFVGPDLRSGTARNVPGTGVDD